MRAGPAADGDQHLVAADLLAGPSPAATVTTTSVPSRRAACTAVPSRTSTPAARRAAATASPATGSAPASSRSPRSSTVTVEPSALHAVAISQPT